MYRFSYLMTYRESDQCRRRNLNYLLEQLCRDTTLEIILVEQDIASKYKGKQQANLKYIFVENAGPFNKSWGLNIAASAARSERLIFADSDILISEEMLNEISAQMDDGVDAVNPYDGLIDLSQHESQALLTGTHEVQVNRTQNQLNRQAIGEHPPFCGGMFAMTKTLYGLVGGMDERFEGWGGEDDAMSKRIAFFATKMTTLNSMAYHLWHQTTKDTKNSSPAYLRNLSLLTMYYERHQSFYKSLAENDAIHNASHAKYIIAEKSLLESDQTPLISCLCVTRGRLSLLARAIECFRAQNYPHKELIVVYEADDIETFTFLKGISNDEIKPHVIAVEPKRSLGELRNLSIEIASGEFICQWDDDDWYHPERLTKQLASALRQNKAASILPRWLIHQRDSDKVYCSNVRLWEGSLLCRKNILPANYAYDKKRKGEDSKLIETLFINDQLAIEDFPELYVYCLSGENTWDHAHFEKILSASVELSRQDAEIVKERITHPS